jgi:hypothetical protein
LNTKPEAEPLTANSTPGTLTVAVKEGDNFELRVAEMKTGPYVAAAIAATCFTSGTIGEITLDTAVAAMTETAKCVKEGDMRDVEAVLMSQASALNVMFASLVSRSAQNRKMGQFDATERYLKLAFKAQNQFRMALESLSNIENPPAIDARQANIAHAPQQVNNGNAGPSRAQKPQEPPNKLSENGNEKRVDGRAPEATGRGDKALEAV